LAMRDFTLVNPTKISSLKRTNPRNDSFHPTMPPSLKLRFFALENAWSESDPFLFGGTKGLCSAAKMLVVESVSHASKGLRTLTWRIIPVDVSSK